MYRLKLNKKYMITTNQSAYVNLKVQVEGVISYQNTLKYNFDIMTLAINEKVIAANDDTYIKDNEYYLCRDDKDRYVILWADILDESKCNRIDGIYIGKTTISVSDNTNSDISSIIEDITNYAKTNHNVDLSIDTKDMFKVTDDSVEDKLAAQVREYEALLNELKGFATIIPVMRSISSTDLNKKVNDINDNIAILQDKVNTLVDGL